ncbi:MAG TPA: hypothetical protein VLC53_15285, partial [Myxococcota bacterium]|nr:hypothetical protein [Myxococcota bacterium]
MELYAARGAVGQLEARLALARGRARFEVVAALAWHLRQRDTRRAEQFAADARELLPEAGPGRHADQARLTLARAECALLLARIDEAGEQAARAGESFAALDDAAGVGDAALLRARIAEARGDRERELPCYREALDAYRHAGDPERIAHARAAAMLASGFGDPAAMAAELEAIHAETHEPSPAVRAHLRFLDGVAAFQRGAFLEAVPALRAAALEAHECGLCEQGFRAEAGLVSAQSNLGDREAA